MTLKNIIYLTAAIFMLSCAGKKADEKPAAEKTTEAIDKIVEVKTQLLQVQDFNYELISNGIIAAANKAELKFKSQEIIRKIYVKNGDRVVKGQKLAELDRFQLEIDKAQAKEALERTKLDLQDALISQGYFMNDTANIPDEVLKVARIRSNYEQSRNNFIAAEYKLDAASLYAPFDGVIANLTVKEFNQSGSDPFCTIVDNHNLEVVFNILENELSLIQLNYKVLISPFSLPDVKIEGHISEINPMIDKNGMVRLKAFIGNRDSRLYEGMNVKVRVQLLLGKQLVVPKSAVVLRTNKKVVFTFKNDRANWVYVQTAQENSDSYVISDGLKEGDMVIYDGNINLADQTPVKVID
ncbi:MAG: efflux RND transporter periplasmic adaptor subunit [Prevotellaceae bacterium]|jgi:RND family efflux transporter MFP subunit|nr:efflux RND transporter periplasmic adaptor subunit [Prevotellaceae bacterium]